MDYKKIGDNILHFLTNSGRSQVDMANALGSSRQVVNKIIKGKKALRTDELVLISQYLNEDLDTLVNGDFSVYSTETETALLCGEIKDEATATFILELVSNLAEIEEMLDDNDIRRDF